MPTKKTAKGAPETVSPELGQTKFKLGDNELQQGKQQAHDEGEKPEQSAGQFSPQEIIALAQSAAALSSVFASKLREVKGEAPAYVAPVTKDEAALFVDAILDRTYRRVPAPANKKRAAEQCPFSGFNRGQLYELFKLRKNGKRVIRNASLAKKGEKHGARFYNVGDAIRSIDQLAADQDRETPAKT